MHQSDTRHPRTTTVIVAACIALALAVILSFMYPQSRDQGWGSPPQDIPRRISGEDAASLDTTVLPRTIPRFMPDQVASDQPRFRDNLDGTVTDLQSGLTWLKKVDCLEQVPWNEASLEVGRLRHGFGCGDFVLRDHSHPGEWRVPTIRELMTLPNLKYYNPALSDTMGVDKWSEGDPFLGVSSYYYWSSTMLNPDEAWYMYLYNGVLGLSRLSEPYVVWPVKGNLAFRWKVDS